MVLSISRLLVWWKLKFSLVRTKGTTRDIFINPLKIDRINVSLLLRFDSVEFSVDFWFEKCESHLIPCESYQSCESLGQKQKVKSSRIKFSILIAFELIYERNSWHRSFRWSFAWHVGFLWRGVDAITKTINFREKAWLEVSWVGESQINRFDRLPVPKWMTHSEARLISWSEGPKLKKVSFETTTSKCI